MPLVVLNDRRIGIQVLSLWTSKTILLFLVDQFTFQVLAVSDAATPERNEGPFALLLKCADDGRRTVATIGGRFHNRDLALLFDSLELLQIGLAVVPRSGGDVSVRNDATVGIDALMHFALYLSCLGVPFFCANVASGSVRLVCV